MTRRYNTLSHDRSVWTLPDYLYFAAGILVVLVTAFALACLYLANPASAHWNPKYASADQATKEWYQSAQLTAPAQKRFNFKSCCNNSDTVETKFKVDNSTGADEWFYLDKDGTWKNIPSDVIHWNESGPQGQAVLFAIGGEPTCFFPPASGN